LVSPPNTVFGSFVAVSPNGRLLAFAAAPANGTSSPWLRPLDSLVARPLPGNEGASQALSSPDSPALGVIPPGQPQTIDLGGGGSQVVADVTVDGRGGTWGPDGTIVFAPSFQGGIYRVRATGGDPTPVTVLDAARKEQTHRWPSFLPDGRHFLYYASR